MKAELLLSCVQLVIGWRGRALLPPIDLEVRRGDLAIVVGRNGAGKTTWFKTVLGLSPPVSGRVVRPALRLAYVPQSLTLERILPLRARDVVLQGRLRSWSFLRPLAARADHAAVDRALEEAGAGDLADATYRELSKGQRQRVLFARLLASEADLALLDEPTAAMDPQSERASVAQLARLAHERGLGVVVVTHALEQAVAAADYVLLLDRAGGAVTFGKRDAVVQQEAYRRYEAAARGEVSGAGALAPAEEWA